MRRSWLLAVPALALSLAGCARNESSRNGSSGTEQQQVQQEQRRTEPRTDSEQAVRHDTGAVGAAARQGASDLREGARDAATGAKEAGKGIGSAAREGARDVRKGAKDVKKGVKEGVRDQSENRPRTLVPSDEGRPASGM